MSTKNYEKRKIWDKLSYRSTPFTAHVIVTLVYLCWPRAGAVFLSFLCEIKPLFMFTSKASLRLYIAAAAWLVSTLG